MKKKYDWRKMRDGEDYVFTDVQNGGAIVDIRMLTYNHAPYIRHAIESVLMQETEYSYRLIIADDGSTDGTTEIVREYQQRYPDRIAAIIWKYNTGLHSKKGCNGIVLSRHCTAKYVATLEGDDYWTSPHKLQKAVSFLEGHPEYIGYAHNIIPVDENERVLHSMYARYVVHPLQEEHVYYRESVMNRDKLQDGVLAHTASIISRNYFLDWNEEMWDDMFQCSGPGDQVQTNCLGLSGEVYYDREIMSHYRLLFHGHSWVARTIGRNNTLRDFRTIRDQDKFVKKVYGIENRAFSHILNNIYQASQEMLLRDFNYENLITYIQVMVLLGQRKLEQRFGEDQRV